MLVDVAAEIDPSSNALPPVQIETDADGFDYRRGEIVALDLDPAALAAAVDLGFSIAQTIDVESIGARVYLLRSNRDLTAPEAIALLSKSAPGAALAPNHLFYAPSGDGRASAVAAAPLAGPACSCRIAMLDTAVDPRHPSLAGVTVHQRAFVGDAAFIAPHGSAVASLLFGRESGRSELFVADVFGGGDSRSGAASVVIRGLEWLAASGAPVINISLAGASNPVVEAIIGRLGARGVVVVAAVGNDGPAAPPAYPAALQSVVAVTAVDDQGQIYRYAVRGDHVDFAARGVRVTAAAPGGGYVQVTGTSFAAPIVAGRIALDITRTRHAGPAVVRDLQQAATDLGAPGRDRVYGFGQLERALP